MTVKRQIYFEVRGYGWTVVEHADGSFVGTCTPTPGTTLTVRAGSTEESKHQAARAIEGYEKDVLDAETTLVDIKVEVPE